LTLGTAGDELLAVASVQVSMGVVVSTPVKAAMPPEAGTGAEKLKA
jgi:hypothetical protein